MEDNKKQNQAIAVKHSLFKSYKAIIILLHGIEKDLEKLDCKLLVKFPDRSITNQAEEEIKDAIFYISQLMGTAVLYDLEDK